MKAPEKIYIFEQDFQRKDHKVMYGVNQDKDIKGLIEYTRTDAFIEKATEWLCNNYDKYIRVIGSSIYPAYSDLCRDFQNYMKGE